MFCVMLLSNCIIIFLAMVATLLADAVIYGLPGRSLNISCHMWNPTGWRRVTSETQQELQNSERVSISGPHLRIIRFAHDDVGIYYCYRPGDVERCTQINSYGVLHIASRA